jgi:hypothetical protein
VGLIGAPGGLFIYVLIASHYKQRGSNDAVGIDSLAVNLAATCLLTVMGCLFVLWQFTQVDHIPRHVTPTTFALLPFIIILIINIISNCSKPSILFWATIGFTFTYFVCPLLYGPAYVYVKKKSVPATYAKGESGLFIPELSGGDYVELKNELLQHIPDTDIPAVWVVERRAMALELPERGTPALLSMRASVGQEMVGGINHISDNRLKTTQPVAIFMLIPKNYELGDPPTTGEKARGMFNDATNWEQVELKGASIQLWKTILYPDDK